MSLGTIQSHIENGQYSVLISLETDVITDKIARIEEKQVDISDQLTDLLADIAAAEAELEALLPNDDPWLDLAAERINELREQIFVWQYRRRMLNLKWTALQKRKAYLLNATPEGPTVNIWCADLTEDLSGEVGVLEIAGLRENGFNIQPGYEGNAAYDDIRDGALAPAIAVPASGIYYNWAMQSGWQKWMPTYRWGIITAINYVSHICNVQLDPMVNLDSGLNVNKMALLSGVPIEYMSCDSAAFEVADVVIVKFENQDWGSPKVIGFMDHPQSCTWEPWDDADLLDPPEIPILCKNHDWKVYTALTSNEMCPSLPIHDVQLLGATSDASLAGGVLEVSQTSAEFSYNDTIMFTWVASESDPARVANTLKFKVSATLASATSVYDYGVIWIYDNDPPYDYALFYFACGNPSDPLIAPPAYYIGDNGGGEISLTLTDYGLKSDVPIGAVVIEAFVNWPATIAYSLDYIYLL